MAQTLSLRLAGSADYDAIGELVFNAVHTGNDAYSEAEKQAWMPKQPSGVDWAARLSRQTVWLAEHKTLPVGVMTLAPDGYVDLAYIAADHRGEGLFRRLYSELETDAAEQGVERLWVHASLMAQPAFQSVGFATVRPDPVEKHGQVLQRALMEKRLILRGDDA